ncbi:MAG: hydroxyacylglutathione hydrolase [Pseudomonadales bacterium]|nr:hydroxyacylglutathione hydrolase [Pseudomonadales bacterium]
MTGLPAFNDNYLWLIDNGQAAVVVDPGDARPVLQALAQRGLQLDSILVTHHHADHIGGIDALLQQYPVPVIGPADKRIPQLTRRVAENDTCTVLGTEARVIEVPGHTLHHIAYFIDRSDVFGAPVLFCGDTLFAAGCGRVFEGSFAQMRQSLATLRELPGSTKIYCAHEYTLANLAFASAVEPDNQALQQRIATVKALRDAGQASVPSLMADERATNPFLRYDSAAVIASAQQRQRAGDGHIDSDSVFAIIRQWKDSF